MARINIEDKLFRDSRFHKLASEVGGVTMALGVIVQAFMLAQEFWIENERPIPSVRFRSIPFNENMISCGLAEYVQNGDFVYVKGSENQFSWLTQRRRAGMNNKGKKRKRNETELNGTKRVESSYSYSSSFSSSNSSSSSKNKSSEVEEKSSPSAGAQVFMAYRDAYVSRYGTEPVRNAKVNSNCAQLAKRLGADAIEVVKFYLNHNDSFFIRDQHPISLCLAKAEGLYTQWKNGKAVTSRDVKKAENIIGTMETLAMLEKGEI